MAGGGIRASNVRSIALHTGIREVHTSLNAAAKTGGSDGGVEIHRLRSRFAPFVVTENDVRAFKSALFEPATSER